MREKQKTRITWLLLPIILWTFAGGPSFAALAATEQAREAAREQARNALPRDFDEVVAELSSALNGVRDGDGDALDKAMALRAEIRDRDSALQQEFADVEAMIKDKGLPEEILQRHRDFVNDYQKRLATVETNLSRVEHGAVTPEGFLERAWFNTKTFFTGDPVREEAAADTAELLNSFRPKRIQKSFKPEDLPFRRLTPQQDLKPKETAEEWRRALDPAAQTSDLGKALGAIGDTIIPAAMAQSNDLPGPEDLAETIEIQFTPKIVALAAQLNNSPVEIYNWVRNNIDFVPVWGSIQGADYCRQTRVCNAFDTASLLIALLRASGISAQYQFGTIEADEESAKNWLGGFLDLEDAGRFAAAGGTPTTLHTKLGGQQVLRLDHVWVRAFINYIPSQGAALGSPDTWIPMDPSYKLYTYSDRLDPETLITTDIDQVVADLINSAVVDADGAITSVDVATVSQLPEQLSNELLDSLGLVGPIDTVAKFLQFPEVQLQDVPVVPAALDYTVVASGPAISDLPDSLRHSLTISVSTPDLFGGFPTLEYMAYLPEFAGKQVSLRFSAASDADEQAMTSFLNGLNGDVNALPVTFPFAAFNFTAELRVDDQIVATGPPMPFGATQELNLIFDAPGAPGTPISNEINVGEFIAIGIDLARISEEQLAKHEQDLIELDANIIAYTGAPGEPAPFAGDIRAEFFATIIDSWFASVDFFKEGTYRDADAAWARYPSAGLFFADIAQEQLFGVPWRLRSTGLIMDIDRNLSVSESRIGRPDLLRSATLVQGIIGSSLESLLPLNFIKANPDYFGAGFAISAADVISRSLQQGIPLHTLTSQNIDAVKPRLVYDADTIRDISAAVAAGNTVIVPETPILESGQSFFGYVVFDEETGGGDYIVGQSFSGGIVKALLGLMGGVAGAMLGEAKKSLPDGKYWRSIGKWFPYAAIAIDAIAKIYWVIDNKVATTEQKITAISFILLFSILSVLLIGGLSTFGGPFGFFIGIAAGLAFSGLLDVVLRKICTCFAAIFKLPRRRRPEFKTIPMFAQWDEREAGPHIGPRVSVAESI